MRLPRRRFLQFAGVAAATAAPLFPQLASALDYPNHSVRIIVGFPPGGPTDIFARVIGQWLSDTLGQPFVVENRPGAGSTIGVQAVVSAPPDGYTLLLVSTSAVISALYYKNLNFNMIRDIAPVCGISNEPLVMVVNPAVPAKTVPEFIAYARANPGKIVMASVGNGTTPHLAGELFKLMAGVDLLHVPYQGSAPALTDLLGGRADVLFEAMPTVIGYINGGKLRPLGVGTATRSEVFPNLPAIAEFLPGYQATVWFGVCAPAKTPAEIVQRLNKAINAGLNDPKLHARILEVGGTPLVGSTADFEKLFVDDSEKWAKVMREANVKAE
ncbi:MAG TPA: tripartite tricarboxylate transporter substrate binding protein [Xanthobacteraceae bacterium]|nr:tripartite tricarboxylate transporter substrate binding protein [Xanthobacteraceae bacterium]